MPKYAIEVIPEEFIVLAKLAGFGSDYELARRMGVDRATLSRALAGEFQPGPGFIAGALRALEPADFHKMFRVVVVEKSNTSLPCEGRCNEDVTATVADAVNDHRIGCPVRQKVGTTLRNLYEPKRHGGPHFGLVELARRYKVESADIRELIVEAGGTIRPKGVNSRQWRRSNNTSTEGTGRRLDSNRDAPGSGSVRHELPRDRRGHRG